MGGSQDIYDTYHSVKRYNPNQVPPQINSNNNLYVQSVNPNSNNKLNPYYSSNSNI